MTHHVSIKRDLSAVHRDVQSLQMQQELIRVSFSLFVEILKSYFVIDKNAAVTLAKCFDKVLHKQICYF